MKSTKNTIKQALAASAIAIGGFAAGAITTQTETQQLEEKIQTTQAQQEILKKQNYELHLDLIRRDNPHEWELYGDYFSGIGYRKPSGFAKLGTTKDGYTYLTK